MQTYYQVIEIGTYPSKLTHAKVVPVCKGEDKTDPSNYRPISLLSVFHRIFVKTMYRRLMAFFAIHSMALGKNIQLNMH